MSAGGIAGNSLAGKICSPSTGTVKVVLADDHHLVRHAIKSIINSFEGVTVVGEAEDATSALKVVNETNPDLLILDIGLPSRSGLDVLYEIKRRGLPTKVMMLSMYDDEQRVKQAIAGGAFSYVAKNSSPSELLAAIRSASCGQFYLSKQFQHIDPKLLGDSAEKTESKQDPLDLLSPREREMFFLLAEGLPNRIIAKRLFISPRTVETHRARVIKKLGFKSNADLIRYAIKHGLVGV